MMHFRPIHDKKKTVNTKNANYDAALLQPRLEYVKVTAMPASVQSCNPLCRPSADP